MTIVFLSYSHADEKHRLKFESALSNLRRQNLVVSWHDRLIRPGQDWSREIHENLEAAQLTLLLVSPDFISSDYCYGIEMTRALERHEQGLTTVIPILVRPVDWKGTPFQKLQALPKNALPITKWSNRDDAWLDVVIGIRRVLEPVGVVAVQAPPVRLHPTPNAAANVAAAPVAAPRPALESQEEPHGSGAAAAAPSSPGSILRELSEAKPLAESALSSTSLGRHPVHGQVVVKRLKSPAAECLAWLDSDVYASVQGWRVLDQIVSADGQRTLVLKWLDGLPLSELVRPGNVIRGALLDDLVLQVLKQLAPLSAGPQVAVHRDVTPSNMILRFNGPQALVELIDYESGCFAHDEQAPLSVTGFTPIEQRQGLAIPASDLYSLACSAYFLATSNAPSGNPDEPEELRTYLGKDSQFTDYYRGRVVLSQSLALDAAKRPTSAHAILQAGRVSHDSTVRAKARMLGMFETPTNSVALYDSYYLARSKHQ